MTVGELIEILEDYPKDREVRVGEFFSEEEWKKRINLV